MFAGAYSSLDWEGTQRMGKREEDEKDLMENERTEKYGTGTDATEGGEKEKDRTET